MQERDELLTFRFLYILLPFLMCKSKVQTFVALVSRSSKIMFLLLFAHGIPLLIATSAVNIVSIMIRIMNAGIKSYLLTMT